MNMLIHSSEWIFNPMRYTGYRKISASIQHFLLETTKLYDQKMKQYFDFATMTSATENTGIYLLVDVEIVYLIHVQHLTFLLSRIHNKIHTNVPKYSSKK